MKKHITIMVSVILMLTLSSKSQSVNNLLHFGLLNDDLTYSRLQAGKGSKYSPLSSYDDLKKKKKKKKKKKSKDNSDSDFALGPQLGYLKGGAVGNILLGLSGEYVKDESSGVIASVSYALPRTFASSTYILDLSSGVDQKEVASSIKISGIQLGLEYKRYFGEHEYGEGTGIYWFGGIGLLLFKASEEVTESYDESVYGPKSKYASKDNYSNFTLNAGIGIDFMAGPGRGFTELKANLPANSQNGQAVDVEIPFTIQLNAGYRFLF